MKSPSKGIHVSELLYSDLPLRYDLNNDGNYGMQPTRQMANARHMQEGGKLHAVAVSDATSDDLAEIINLDARTTGFARADFWEDLFRRRKASETLCVLVAKSSGKIVGYALGEVRSWPVRAPMCGWLYAIGVDKNFRLQKCASALMTELISRFKQSGVGTVRTVINMDDHLLMSFLRSFGMTTGNFVELEMTLPDSA